jgi:hypothetical protein
MKYSYYFFVLIIGMSCYSNKKERTVEVKYYNNGDTSKIYHLKGDIFDGIYKEYHKNGNLKVYRFYQDGEVFYEKNFDQNNTYQGGRIAINYPNETFEKSEFKLGDSINIGATLIHSMLKRPYIAIDFININEEKRDTIATLSGSNNKVGFYFKPDSIGNYKFEINVYEVSHDNNMIYGYQKDTIKFRVQ